MAAAAHFLIRKKLFNSKYPQLLVAKDFAVAEKKLHLAVSGRKYNPGKKAPKKRHTSDVKTSDPKPSTSQAQPQDESISEQHPQDQSISEQQPQGVSTTEQQPQGEAATDTQQGPVPSQFSDDDELPDAFAIATKTLVMKDPRSIPKKPKYSYDQKHSTFNPLYLCFIFFFTDQEKKNKIHTRKTHVLPLKCQVHQNFFDLLFTKNHVLAYNIYFSSFFSTNQTFN